LLGRCRTGTISTMRGNRLSAASGLVMLLAVLAGCDGGSAGPANHGSPSGSTTAAPTAGDTTPLTTPATRAETDADYLRIAAAESERTLRRAPVPPGAHPLPGRPEGWPRSLRIGLSPENTHLTRMAWYAVPLSFDAVQQFLQDHHPRTMAFKGGGSGPALGEVDFRARHPRRPEAYTDPSLLVQWKDVGQRTVIRYAAVLASRGVRDAASFVPGDVTSVDVEHLRDRLGASNDFRVVSTVRFTAEADPDALHKVVATLDGLYGPPLANTQSSCDFYMQDFYRFIVHAGSGDLTYDWGGSGSGGGCAGIVVLRDGQPVGDGLDPGDLYQVVAKILAHHRLRG
jgi:hypothetical protein